MLEPRRSLHMQHNDKKQERMHYLVVVGSESGFRQILQSPLPQEARVLMWRYFQCSISYAQ